MNYAALKPFLLLALVGVLATACSRSHGYKAQRKNKTPRHMVMSQAEKVSVNYDARENRKAINKNLKNKEANLKHAEKQRKKQVTELTAANNTSKVANKARKNRPHEAFNFY